MPSALEHTTTGISVLVAESGVPDCPLASLVFTRPYGLVVAHPDPDCPRASRGPGCTPGQLPPGHEVQLCAVCSGTGPAGAPTLPGPVQALLWSAWLDVARAAGAAVTARDLLTQVISCPDPSGLWPVAGTDTEQRPGEASGLVSAADIVGSPLRGGLGTGTASLHLGFAAGTCRALAGELPAGTAASTLAAGALAQVEYSLAHATRQVAGLTSVWEQARAAWLPPATVSAQALVHVRPSWTASLWSSQYGDDIRTLALLVCAPVVAARDGHVLVRVPDVTVPGLCATFGRDPHELACPAAGPVDDLTAALALAAVAANADDDEAQLPLTQALQAVGAAVQDPSRHAGSRRH